MRTSIEQEQEENRLLRILPAASYKRLARHFETLPLVQKTVIYRAKQSIDYLYFPQEGVLSLLTPMKNGARVEVATVGNEGMVGVGVTLDAVHPYLDTICQVPGVATRVKTASFRKELERNPDLRHLMLRYSLSVMIQFTQAVACNRLHNVEQRCARWLLMTRDRAHSNTFSLTQEYLAAMLGVRRASVTTVAGELQKRKLIHYARGIIRILNPKRLEKSACECYRVIKIETDRLIR